MIDIRVNGWVALALLIACVVLVAKLELAEIRLSNMQVLVSSLHWHLVRAPLETAVNAERASQEAGAGESSNGKI